MASSVNVRFDPTSGGTFNQVVSAPAPATQLGIDACTESGEDTAFDYGNGRDEGCRLIVQTVCSIVAGAFGVIALIVGVFSSSGLAGIGISCGVWLTGQGIWAVVALVMAHRARKRAFVKSKPIPRDLLCCSTTFTTFNAFTTVGLLAAATAALFLESTTVGALLYIAMIACFVGSICGCCATCKAGCGCLCCDYGHLSYSMLPNTGGYLATINNPDEVSIQAAPVHSGYEHQTGSAAREAQATLLAVPIAQPMALPNQKGSG